MLKFKRKVKKTIQEDMNDLSHEKFLRESETIDEGKDGRIDELKSDLSKAAKGIEKNLKKALSALDRNVKDVNSGRFDGEGMVERVGDDLELCADAFELAEKALLSSVNLMMASKGADGPFSRDAKSARGDVESIIK